MAIFSNKYFFNIILLVKTKDAYNMKKIFNTVFGLLNFQEKKSIISNASIPLRQEEELTAHINIIFEQQEKERIIRWLMQSIRESLELDKVLEKTSEEIGKFLQVNRCMIALLDKKNEQIVFKTEYLSDNTMKPMLTTLKNVDYKSIKYWADFLSRKLYTRTVNDYTKENLDLQTINVFKQFNIQSYIVTPIFNQNEVLGAIVVTQDSNIRIWEQAHEELLNDISNQLAIAIKQSMLYEKVQVATQLKTDFLSGMSHELRTPLNAIIGFSQMLNDKEYGALNPKQKRFIKNISDSSEYLLKMVNDLLDLSKIESGVMDINYTNFNLWSAIYESTSILNGIAAKKNIYLEFDVEKNLHISADLIKFKQIIYNLLSNALKFSENDEKIKIIAQKTNGGVKIEIHDNGIGISEQDRDKIFKKYSQINSNNINNQEGTGLGLILTKKLVEMHNGKIDFEPKANKGTVFWFIFPDVDAQTPV